MINEIIGILSIIVAILSISFAIIQNKKAKHFQNKLAEAQKIFAKSNIKFECFQTFYNDIIYTGNFPEKSGVIVPFNLYFGNIGDKKIRNSKLYLTFPDAIHESNINNLNLKTKGSFEKRKFKLVDKSEFRHMLAFDYGDIGPGVGMLHQDFFIIGDYNHTDTTHVELKTEIETADKKKGILKSEIAIKWVVQFILRHDENSETGNCSIQIWNTSKKTINEYLSFGKQGSKENYFEKYLNKQNWLSRKFLKKRLKYFWEISVQKYFLLIELELVKDTKKHPLPKNTPADAKNYTIYKAKIKNQKIALELNNGEFELIDREEFVKMQPISNFQINKQYLT